ncbi:MAG: cytochrome P450 [Candidatus Binatia bacterium]
MHFDPFTDATLADPYPHYAALRAEDPVHWSEKLRAWVLFRYDDVATAFRDDVRFSADRRRASRASRPGLQPPAQVDLRTVSSDPPDCLAVRALLNAALVPRVRAIAPRIDAIVEELVAGLAGRTEVDLVTDFAYALPIRVIAELLEVPETERARFQDLSRTIARGMDRFYGSEDVSTGLYEIGAYFLGLVRECTDAPGDDLLGRLLRAEHQGDRLAPLEVVAMCSALVFAGHETTANLIANGVLALLRHPGELERLRADPSLAAPAVEELLRYDTPPQFISRVVGESCEVRGKALRPGDSVLLGIGSANRDPVAFGEPDRLDLARSPNPHVGFGLGTHFCPGAQLARMEARAAIPALLARFSRLELAGEPVWRRTIILRGLERLPVRLG